MRKGLLIFFLLTWAHGMLLNAQTIFEKLLLKIDSSLQAQNEKFPDEHIVIVTDKNEYLAGETVWVSFFVNSGTEPSFVSKTIYAEVTSANGAVIAKKMFPVENGYCHADINIPGATPSGVYALNVYSSWMRNFETPVSTQTIFVSGNDYAAKPFIFSFNDPVATKVEIVPEGGSFVPGVACNFIVRLTGANKLPVNDSFYITEDEKLIAADKTESGLASLSFIYTPGKKYKLQAGVFTGGFEFANITGVQLQANVSGQTKYFLSLEKSLGISSNKFLLAGIRHHEICYQSVFDFEEGTTTAPITRSKLPTGVIDFYVFDENETIVAFRRVYNPPPPDDLILDNPDGDKTIVNFSNEIKTGLITVTAINQASISTIPVDRFNSIQSEKYLATEQAFHFPQNPTENSIIKIDQLLSLQTNPLLGRPWSLSEPTVKYMVESGITLKGNVAPYAGSGGDKGYHVEMLVRGEDSSRILARANALPNGDFAVMDLQYKKQATVFYQGHNPKNSNELMKVEIYPSYIDTLKKSSYFPPVLFPRVPVDKKVDFVLSKKLDSLLALDSQYHFLEGVTVKAKRKTKLDTLRQEYLSPIFDDGSAQILVPENQQYVSIWHYLRANVPGLTIVGDILNPEDITFSRYTLLPRVNNTGEDIEMENPDGIYFFLNEIQVKSDVISSINMADVILVTVSKQPSPALGAYNGYISVYTKKGVAYDINLTKKLASVKRTGYSLTRNSYIADDWRPVSTSTIIVRSIEKDSKPIQLKLSTAQTYKIIISGRDAKGRVLVDEKIIGGNPSTPK